MEKIYISIKTIDSLASWNNIMTHKSISNHWIMEIIHVATVKYENFSFH